MANKERIEIYIEVKQKRILAALKRRDGRSMADHIRQAIDEYIERTKPGGKDASN